ncbi:MAG: hypothetical protein HKO07_08205, partial [Pseudomonadales bacterium]|nr:hypothetical protein [Pseudomonadales bacterium]
LGDDYVNPADISAGDASTRAATDSSRAAVGAGSANAAPENWLSQIDALIRSENVSTAQLRYSETVSEMLAVSAVQSLDTSLNLLQGDFRPATASAEQRRFLRKLSGAVAACVALFLVITLGGGFYLNTRADHFFDRSVAMYRELFPKQRKVVDPVRQMKRQLRGSSVGATTSDFLPLLDAASRSLKSLEATDGEEPAIQQLRYDTQRGHIAIDLHASNIDQLEAYRDLLAAEGLEVDILSANQDGDSIKGRIQVGRS